MVRVLAHTQQVGRRETGSTANLRVHWYCPTIPAVRPVYWQCSKYTGCMPSILAVCPVYWQYASILLVQYTGNRPVGQYTVSMPSILFVCPLYCQHAQYTVSMPSILLRPMVLSHKGNAILKRTTSTFVGSTIPVSYTHLTLPTIYSV